MIIDMNCWLGAWPFQTFSLNTPDKLARHLKAEGISKAFVSPVESILHPDPHAQSLHLLKRVRGKPGLVPVPVLDPSLSHWRECLDAFDEAGFGRVVKVVPNYHRYDLNARCADELADVLARKPRRALMIQMRVEDERQHYPLMKVSGVPVDAVIALAKRHSHLRMLCLSPYRDEAIRIVNETGNVFADISFVEYQNTIKNILARLSENRLVFGSHTPFFYTKANLMKLRHAEVPPGDIRRIESGNARKLLEADWKR